MSEVRRNGDYEQWVKFFLRALYESAEDAVETIEKLSALHEENIEKLRLIKRNKNILALFEYVERNPIIETKKTAKELGIAYNTVAKAIGVLAENGILSEIPVHSCIRMKVILIF